MSIIYDALRKVENTPEAPKRARSKSRPYLLSILIACFGFWLGNLILTQPKEITAPPLKSPPLFYTPSEFPLEPAAPEPQAKSVPFFTLSGVFASDDQSYALVNNRIVRLGDVIEGAKVKQIDNSGVNLEFEGSEIRLKR